MKITYLSLAALVVALAAPGQAAAKAGDVQLKVFATYVAPDGKISDVKTDLIGLPAGTQAKADDNVTPTVAIEYFVTGAVSLETIAGVTQHDVNGRGALNGATLVSDAKIVPATLTLKYHFGAEGGVRPYVGAGPSYFIFIDEKPGATTRTLGATRQKMGDKFGAALQAGIDVPVNARGLALSLDAKRYFLRPTATWYAGNAEVLKTRHKLDPWVISAGVAFRF
ncbi:OmpW family protein [Sphingopyxis sp.]|uniref:OmpW/AlkL family protein n=1 Tax=Sphingopyxis sp. TaxID=1908224 RepID=UPI0035AF0582